MDIITAQRRKLSSCRGANSPLTVIAIWQAICFKIVDQKCAVCASSIDSIVIKIDLIVIRIDSIVIKIDSIVIRIDSIVIKINSIVIRIDSIVIKIDSILEAHTAHFWIDNFETNSLPYLTVTKIANKERFSKYILKRMDKWEV